MTNDEKKKKEVVHDPEYTVQISVRIYPRYHYGKGERFELEVKGDFDVLKYAQPGRTIQAAIGENLLVVHEKWMAGGYDDKDEDG